jgi:hypothetical protein
MSELWIMLNDPTHIFWGVTITKKPGGTPEMVVSHPDETLQEPYVVEEMQSEGLLLIFTDEEGARSQAEYLIKEWKFDRNSLGLVQGNIKAMMNLIDTMNQKVVQNTGRSLRAEVYHMNGDNCLDYEIIYSNWIIKH